MYIWCRLILIVMQYCHLVDFFPLHFFCSLDKTEALLHSGFDTEAPEKCGRE